MSRGGRPKGPDIIDIGSKWDELRIHFDPKWLIPAVIVVLLVVWFALGGPIYTVAPEQQGVVQTFGRYTKTTDPGLHFKMPWPIQTVETPNVQEIKSIEFGFRSHTYGDEVTYTDFTDDSALLQEARMLTGDENVVDVGMAVQYQISDPINYLFNYRPGDVSKTLRNIGAAVLRQEVGDRPIDDVLTTRKTEVMGEVKEKMQELANAYGCGVTVTGVQLQDVKPPAEVRDAFQEVASAREEREQIINEALAYRREELPKSEGEAERIKLEAQGYREARVAESEGAVARFLALTKEYRVAPDATRTRLYLEAMEELLPKVNLSVIDEEAGLVNLRQWGNQSGGQLVQQGSPRTAQSPNPERSNR